MGISEHADVIRKARLALKQSPSQDYAAIVADEIQDFRTADLVLLRALVREAPNDIFVVGDPTSASTATRPRCRAAASASAASAPASSASTIETRRRSATGPSPASTASRSTTSTRASTGSRASVRCDPATPPTSRCSPTSPPTPATSPAWSAPGWLRASRPSTSASPCAPRRYWRTPTPRPCAATASRPSRSTPTPPTPSAPASASPPCTASRASSSRMILASVQKGTMPFEDAAYTSRDKTARALHDEGERKLLLHPRPRHPCHHRPQGALPLRLSISLGLPIALPDLTRWTREAISRPDR
jgi:hypothetical protein